MRPYPPLLYGAGLLLALVGHLVAPLALPGVWWVRLLGLAPVAVAAVLALSAERAFARAQTPMMPFTNASSLLTSGPFRISRNPIYLGFTLAVVGIALLSASWWPLITLPLVVAAMTWVIRGEEQRLTEIFGDDYRRYRARVRRWL